MYSNDTVRHLFTDEVVSDLNVFRSVTVGVVMYHGYGGHVVLIQNSRFTLGETKAMKETSCPHNLLVLRKLES